MKIMDFSESIAASDLKIGRSRQLIGFMTVYEYLRSRSFTYEIQICCCFSQKPLGHI